MGSLIKHFAASILPGTAQASPVTVALAMPGRTVVGVRIRVPPGPRGLMGFRLTASGGPVIPEDPGQFLVADAEVFDWDLVDVPQGAAWQLQGYNTGAFAHTVYLDFRVLPLAGERGGPTLAPLVINQ